MRFLSDPASSLQDLGGVYQIRNTSNGRVYVGSCKSFRKRFNEHLSSLKSNRHKNQFLLRDWIKCGIDAFVFLVLETVVDDKETRLATEQRYLDVLYDNQVQCYNLNPNAHSNAGPSRNPEETRRKLLIARKGKKPRLGMHNSEEHKRKNGQAHAKTYRVTLISPTGIMHANVSNLREFSRTHGLDQRNLLRVINGERAYHKGWRLFHAV